MSATFGDVAFHFGDARGCAWSAPSKTWERDRRSALSVLIVHMEESKPARVDRDNCRHHVWWGPEKLEQNRRFIFPQGAIALLGGYFGGWLPDGDVRLE
jgi:hypothetical protein